MPLQVQVQHKLTLQACSTIPRRGTEAAPILEFTHSLIPTPTPEEGKLSLRYGWRAFILEKILTTRGIMRKRPPAQRQEDSWNNLHLEQCSQAEMSLLPRGHLAKSRDVSIITLWVGVASGIWGTEAREAAKHPTMRGGSSYKNNVAQDVKGAEVGTIL